jgi:hypothetical protein
MELYNLINAINMMEISHLDIIACDYNVIFGTIKIIINISVTISWIKFVKQMKSNFLQISCFHLLNFIMIHIKIKLGKKTEI